MSTVSQPNKKDKSSISIAGLAPIRRVKNKSRNESSEVRHPKGFDLIVVMKCARHIYTQMSHIA